MNQLLPLHKHEMEFISLIRKYNKIDATIITDDIALQSIVEHHPALQWAIMRTNRNK